MNFDPLFDKLPWWMDPQYPMGRRDYFWATWGVGVIAILGFLLTCFGVGITGALVQGSDFSIDVLPQWWLAACLMPWMLLLIPLQYRRCKAAQIPYAVIWISYGLQFADLLAYSDDELTFLTLIIWLIALFIWLKPNQMEVVHTQPGS